MGLLGVADPHAVANRNAHVLTLDWLSPAFLIRMLALQRCMPKRTLAQLIGSWAGYVACTSVERLAGRLLYLDQAGLLQRLVQIKQAAGRRANGAPALISFSDVSTLSDAKFADVVAAAATQQRGKLDSDGSIAAEVKAFQAGLKNVAAWQQLCAEAEDKLRELRSQLPPELLAAADAADGEEAEDDGD